MFEEDKIKEMWVDKYSPKTMNDLVVTEPIREHFQNMIDSGDITNMTLAGLHGIGKTTLANILVSELNAISITIPCGVDGSIDTMKGQVTQFCESMSMDNRLKIVILDESDSISGGDRESSGQKALRNIIESNQTDTRFILTCNYVNNLMGPILSRCPPISLKFSAKDAMLRMKYILDDEKIDYTRDDLIMFIDSVVRPIYPDIRRMISTLQNCCSTGQLLINNIEEVNTDLEKFIDELLTMVNGDTPMTKVRKFTLNNRGLFGDDFPKISSMIFNKSVGKCSTSQLKDMTEYIYRMSIVSDPEIQLFGMILTLRG